MRCYRQVILGEDDFAENLAENRRDKHETTESTEECLGKIGASSSDFLKRCSVYSWLTDERRTKRAFKKRSQRVEGPKILLHFQFKKFSVISVVKFDITFLEKRRYHMKMKFLGLITAVLTFAALFTSCGGGGGGGGAGTAPGTAPTYTISGSVSGLAGTVILQNNGANDLSISASGAFTFAINIADGTAYNVTVKTQPAGLTCTASNNTGTIAGANVTNVSVVCAATAFTLGGTMSGLTTGTVILQDNGADDLSISANGAFTFATNIADGAAYNVTVKTQPAGQFWCKASNNTGTMAGANVTTVSVVCAKWTGTKQLGVSGQKTDGFGAAVDSSGNVYVAGSTDGDLNLNTPLTAGTTDFFLTMYDPAGNKVRTKQLGVSGQNTDGFGVAVDSSGNVYVAGSTDGALGSAITGTTDFFLTKYDPSGNIVRTRQLGVSGHTTVAYGVAVDPSGNVYVAGYTDGKLGSDPLMGATDFFLTKYDPSGNIVRTIQLGVSGGLVDTVAYGVAVDSSGNVYVAGYTDGKLGSDPFGGTEDFFVIKYDSSGNIVYTKQLGVSGKNTEAYSVAVDSSGNVYVAGYTDGDLDTNILMGYEDFFVTKYDSSGTKQYTKQLGVSGGVVDTVANGVAVDSSGNVYVAGYTDGDLNLNTPLLAGSTDFFVTKYDSSGTLVRTKQLGVSGKITDAFGVAVDSSSNVFVAGYTFGGLDGNTLTGTTDFFVTKYDSSGNKQ
jgi:hypothetical protein